MMKKRGILLVVLMILVIFASSSALAELTKKYEALGLFTDFEEWGEADDESVLRRLCTGSDHSLCRDMEEDEGDECDAKNRDASQGCIIYSLEYDSDIQDDECFSGYVPPGYNIASNYQP